MHANIIRGLAGFSFVITSLASHVMGASITIPKKKKTKTRNGLLILLAIYSELCAPFFRATRCDRPFSKLFEHIYIYIGEELSVGYIYTYAWKWSRLAQGKIFMIATRAIAIPRDVSPAREPFGFLSYPRVLYTYARVCICIICMCLV